MRRVMDEGADPFHQGKYNGSLVIQDGIYNLLFLSMKEYFNYHYQKPQYHLHLPRHVGQGR